MSTPRPPSLSLYRDGCSPPSRLYLPLSSLSSMENNGSRGCGPILGVWPAVALVLTDILDSECVCVYVWLSVVVGVGPVVLIVGVVSVSCSHRCGSHRM